MDYIDRMAAQCSVSEQILKAIYLSNSLFVHTAQKIKKEGS